VLEALRDIQVTTPDGERHSLLDEIDLISAVSGGAFTAAYYALHRARDFREVCTPLPEPRPPSRHWEQGARARELGSSGVIRRSAARDLEVEYFDEKLFGWAATVAKMS
jgi:NTE family protein